MGIGTFQISLDDFASIDQFSILLLDENFQILFVNEGAKLLYEAETKDLLHQNFKELFLSEEQEDFYEIIRDKEFTKSHKGWHFEIRRSTLKGKLKYVFVTLLPLQLGAANYLLEISFDISSRVKIEQSLRSALISFTKLNELNELLYSTHSSREILYIFLSFLLLKEGLNIKEVDLIQVTGLNQVHFYSFPGDELVRQSKSKENSLTKTYVFKTKVLSMFKIISEMGEKLKPVLLPITASQWNEFVKEASQKASSGGIKIFEIKQKQFSALMRGSIPNFIDFDAVCIPLKVLDEPPLVILLNITGTHYENMNELMAILQLFATHFHLAYMNAVLYELLQERIHELKNAYRQLEESQKKLIRFERLAAIGELTAQIAHEIRNPLVSIGGFARLIRKKSKQGEEVHKFSNIIVSEVERLEGILKNMLDYMKIDQLHTKRLNFNKLIYHTLELFKDNLTSAYSIEFIPDTNCPLIKVDEEKIHQVLINLLQNAIQAMPEGGKITIKTGCNKTHLSLYITDEGEGIPEKIKKRLFDPFITTKPHGTGLGLAITKKILDLHNATISIKNLKPKGTMIHIKFEIG
jgi:PAS domain S-box-containing protein